MKSVLRWAIDNTPAMNTVMVAVLVVGAISLIRMRREVFPEFDLEIIYVTVPYPGASPEEVEKGICQKIEEAVRSLDGIKNLRSVAAEGTGSVILELEADVKDVQKTLNEVRSEVDRIPSFPALAEDPIVKQITLRREAIRLSVIGPDDDSPEAEVKLRKVAEEVRDELLNVPSVSLVEFAGVKNFQIDVEISEDTLRKYDLTLQDVARILRRENVEIPGGTMKTDSQEVLLRGKNKGLTGPEIAKIPLVTHRDGVVLTVGDLGTVRDEFTDTTAIDFTNGRPALVMMVQKTSAEDLLGIVADVKDFIAEKQMPKGYEVKTWVDQSVMVRDRLNLLRRNGIQGMILVFLALAVFLEIRLAFWVAVGVPIAMLGACGILLFAGQTMNMLSMFAFLMALGILVDDAIVVGENIYSHRQLGKAFVPSAVDGTYEVLPSVVASVSTTIIAFVPLLFVLGIMGKFIAVMPLAVIAMLIISLLEVTFILPCHLGHESSLPKWLYGGWSRIPSYVQWGLPLIGLAGLLAFRAFSPKEAGPLWAAYVGLVLCSLLLLGPFFHVLKRLGDLFGWINSASSRILGVIINRVYLPTLRRSLRNPAVVVASAITVLILAAGLVRGKIVPFVSFPKLDSNWIETTVIYPDGTPWQVTDEASRRMERAIRAMNDEYEQNTGRPLVALSHRMVGQGSLSQAAQGNITNGSHIGGLFVELVDASDRDRTSQDIVNEWRKRSGTFSGAESVVFSSESHGPGGAAIEFTLLAAPDRMDAMEEIVERCKAELADYKGVSDIRDDSSPGKWEFQLKVKEKAKAMGIPVADLAETVRASYYGEEVMRLQRGRHEVKLMVRYPRDERRSLANFDDIRVRTGERAERPLTELADVHVVRGYSKINRLDQKRAIKITADVNEAEGNASQIIADLKANYLRDVLKDPAFAGITIRWGGAKEQTDESVFSLVYGLAIALIAMFVLLTFEFRSYFQPMIIMMIVPFGAVGAILGHLVMRLPVTLFSLFGMVALTGVVVNDSIVLIDFINRRVRDGVPLREALLDAGRRRFRPVMLTSVTTIAGLLPLLLERSFQAQVLIPMATSLCFGLLFATVLVLLLVPTFYLLHAQVTSALSRKPEGGPAVQAARRPVEVGQPADVLPVRGVLEIGRPNPK